MYVGCVADTGEELEECGTIHKADIAAYRWVMRLHRKLVVKHWGKVVYSISYKQG